ncbi:MAG: NADH-quinone oxidoreductase subunit L, partial [Chloroflexi bacterium]|nr:NADH-quinone oxidoreductase subunit L [Chloroflexota bacterium]
MLNLEPSVTSGVQWAWLAPALSASAFFAIVLIGRFLPREGAFLSVLAILAGFAVFWYVLLEFLDSGGGEFTVDWFTVGSSTLSWGIIVDELSVVMLGIVTFVALMIQVYSLGYMKDEARFGWYFAVHSLFAASMLALVLADNLLFLYIGWELVG